MSSLAISLIVTGVIVAGGVLGLVLQRVLPERYTMDKARDMIGGVVGQLTLLLVLVNGLLIWTAYGVYSTQQTELQTLVARALEFDLEMRQYGPEADEARGMLRTDLVWAHEQFWGDDTSRAAAYEASYKAMGSLNKFLDGLTPKTPAQTSLLAAARALPALDRIVLHARSPESLPQAHLAQEKVRAASTAQAFVCIGETCSLPVTDPAGLIAAVELTRRN